MQIFKSVKEVADILAGGVLTIGNFDGVHVGHQALIEKALRLRGNKKAGVLTFSPHPSEVLEKKPFVYLTPDKEKIRLLARYGLDVAIIQRIDKTFLKLSADEFIEEILVKQLRVEHVVVGHDFTFGHHAEGNVELLKLRSQQCGFVLHVMPPVKVDGSRCSSSAIRNFLAQGQLLEAKAMLGRPYSLRGIVAQGNQLGSALGFATANLKPFVGFGLKNGIYASVTRVYASPGVKNYVSATSVGTRPTVTDSTEVVVETHCLDEQLELYDQDVEVFFLLYLRDEYKFSSVTALQAQVQKDCQKIRQHQQKHPEFFQVAH